MDQNGENKALLISRFSFLDMSRLGCSEIMGQTLVQYAGSLIGQYFCVIAQVPFMLYNFVEQRCYDTWLVLVQLVPLIWQLCIENIEQHFVSGIDPFFIAC